jgi:hypothetical protein
VKHAALLALALSLSPFQCASDPDPERAMEDSAPAALWDLSERFRADGDLAGRTRVLRYLVDRYPSSRYARRAERELDTPRDPR